jgi:catechol 2,3-dioxygenase-like lactoylglutathione lyase family enzyme
MEASAISHIAICTRDMEKSLAFYRDILGMKVLFPGLSSRPRSEPHLRVGWSR